MVNTDIKNSCGNITAGIADEIFNYIESYSLNGSLTGESFEKGDLEWDADEQKWLQRLFCGNDAASKIQLLPEDIRSDLAAYVQKRMAEDWNFFVEDWNKNTGVRKLEYLTENESKGIVSELIAARLPEYGEHDYDDQMLEEWDRYRAGENFNCMFEVEGSFDQDGQSVICIKFNEQGDVFPGTSDKNIVSVKFTPSEMHYFQDSWVADKEGVKIIDACIHNNTTEHMGEIYMQNSNQTCKIVPGY